MQRAAARLAIIIPITFAIVCVILYVLFGRISRTIIVMLNVPIAVSGGVFLLYIAGHHLSVSAAVGFIALFGVAVQGYLILVVYTWLRGIHWTPVHLMDMAIRRFSFVVKWAAVVLVGLFTSDPMERGWLRS